MDLIEPNRPAQLVVGIRAPARATVSYCLERWAELDPRTRSASYMVVFGDEPGARDTLNSRAIARLKAQFDRPVGAAW